MAAADVPAEPAPAAYRWKFFRAGGFDQALLERGEDLLALASLDQKLWVALSCPVEGIEFDRKTLGFVDSDADGHIRAPDILSALAWAGAAIRKPELLVEGRDRLLLSDIDDGTPEGKTVLAGTALVLAALGKPDAPEISLEDVSDTERIFACARFNGDGIVPPYAAEDPELGDVIRDIVSCLGGDPDRSGEPGATAEKIERFYAEAGSLHAWRTASAGPGVLPFGEETKARYELFLALSPKIEDYFKRCRLAAYDMRAAELLAPSEAEYRKLGDLDLGGDKEAVLRLPLAVPGSGKSLPRRGALNPAWASRVEEFFREVAVPVLGEVSALSDEEWGTVCSRFAPFEAWFSSRPPTAVEKLDPARVAAILAGNGKDALLGLAANDKAVEPDVQAIASVEKLLRYCRDLHPLVNNFVSFRNFYTRRGKATFQAGTLYMDGRSCDLCVPVADVNQHASIATLSRIFLVYCDCTRRGGGEKATIAAGFTAGDSDQLMVGRNGVFYDRKGRDWDATVVRIVEHPISIRQAFWSPYRRVARLIGEQMQKLAAARSRAAEERATAAVIAASAAGKPPPPPPPAFDIAKFAGIFAAIGLAVGAIGTALASVLTGILKLVWWQIPLVFAGIFLLISGPSVLLAWLKLRKRNLGPILDANGWAVNARAKINIPFGASLTAAAKLPENAERSLADPFAEKKRPWTLYLFLLALAALAVYLWRTGALSRWLGG